LSNRRNRGKREGGRNINEGGREGENTNRYRWIDEGRKE
jgi:hypothetical protein